MREVSRTKETEVETMKRVTQKPSDHEQSLNNEQSPTVMRNDPGTNTVTKPSSYRTAYLSTQTTATNFNSHEGDYL